MSGIFIVKGQPSKSTLDEMSQITHEWTMQAARGEISWVCSDCCMSFNGGMPDACPHGVARCTEIILRDKADARRIEGN